MDLSVLTNDYLNYCEFRKELDKKTIKAYRIDLNQYFTLVSCGNPEKHEVERYITYLHVNYKQKTVKRKIASVRAFYNYLEEENVIKDSPFRRVKLKFKEQKVLPRTIPRDAIEKLLNYIHGNAETHEGSVLLRDIAVIEVSFATGARVCEISNLKKECIDLNSGVVRFMGKGNKERYVQIGDATILRLLNNYYKLNKEVIEKCGYFFVNNRGNRFSEQSIRLMLKKYTRLAGIEGKITPHMFRHSVATYLIEEGVDISCVQMILGHSSIRTTQIYIHVATKKQAEILQQSHPRKRMRIVHAA